MIKIQKRGDFIAKILICDDEAGLRSVIKRYAEFEGHITVEVENGLKAVEACNQESFDIIIMDVMMPELDGFSVVKMIRKTSNVPVIMLTARGEEYDKILGFEVGVDDFVVKPFSTREIMLRISAILRRAEKSNIDQESSLVFSKEGFMADITAYKVFVDNEQVKLAPKSYDLLFFLIRNKNIAVSRDKILSEVWGYDYCGDDRTLDTHMKFLRKAMGPYAKFITTLRGMGYRFEG